MADFKLEGELVANIDGMNDQAQKAMYAAAKFVSTELKSFMRSEATWTDRTTNARSGLDSNVVRSKDKVAIVLFHRVPYGPFLEVRWGGKYGIIAPALAAGGPRFVEMVGRLLFK